MVEKLPSGVSTKEPCGHNKRSFLARRVHNEYIKCTTTRETGHHVELCGRSRNPRHACQPPTMQSRSYFGPANLEAQWIADGEASTSQEGPQPRMGGHRRTVATQDIDLATRTSGDPFPAFDPHKDIGIGSFVAMCSPELERRNEAAFYLGKVRALNCVADVEGIMHVIWY